MERKTLFSRFAFYINCAVISFSVSDVSLLFIIFVKGNGTKSDRLLSMIIGLIFWAGIISEIVSYCKADKLRKRVEKKLSLNKANVGIISFFRNKEATISDIGLFTFAIILLLFSLCKVRVMALYVITFFFVFIALQFHSFFNGRNYRCLKYYKTYINKQGATKNV